MAATFVLDQNFPWHAVRFDWPPAIQVVQLAAVAPELTTDYEDWEVLLELSKRGGADGFITNDAKMLQQPTELVALSRTRLALVITDGVGHEPLRATGLVMVHLEEIARRLDGQPRAYVLRPGRLQPVAPGAQLNKVASRLNIPPNELTTAELARIRPRLS